MPSYAKRISQKASKLSNEQLLTLLDNTFEENETLYSIIESISSGMLVVDNNFCILQKNSILESRLDFKLHPDDAKMNMVPIWDIIEDEEIADFLENVLKTKLLTVQKIFQLLQKVVQ